MKRREFVAAAAVSGVGVALPLGQARAMARHAADDRDYIEIRRYQCISGKRMKILDDFVANALAPAYNRLGVTPVGAFKTTYGPDFATLMVVLTHPTLESAATAAARLLDDAQLQSAGKEYFSAPIDDPPFVRMDSRLLRGLAGQPRVSAPETAKGNKPRLMGFRTYVSHNESVARQKVDMVNGGEVEIFWRSGAHVVFFGESLFGEGVPSLSYMLAFSDMAGHDAAWSAFRKDRRRRSIAVKQYHRDR